MEPKYTLTLDQVDAFEGKLREMAALITALVAAGTSDSYFDVGGFAFIMEDKFEELYNAYYEATGQTRRYERCDTK